MKERKYRCVGVAGLTEKLVMLFIVPGEKERGRKERISFVCRRTVKTRRCRSSSTEKRRRREEKEKKKRKKTRIPIFSFFSSVLLSDLRPKD